MMKTNKEKIPVGKRCFDTDGNLCPYYKSIEMKIDKSNCEYSSQCEKNCENCRNIFSTCEFKGKTSSFSAGEYLLAAKYKVCGINLK